MKFNKRYIGIASASYLFAAISFFIFDRSLELGNFTNLVFMLWTAYFSAGYAIINIGVGIYFFSKDERIRDSSFLMAGAAILVIFLLWIFGNLL